MAKNYQEHIMPNREKLQIRPIAGALGAEIEGVNLARELDDEVIAAIREAWLKHLVIFFRDQDLTSSQYMAFAKRLGEPVEYPMVEGIDGFPEITPVIKQAHEEVNFGGLWHSDTTYMQRPPMATMLLARELPPYGGDTIFANQYQAYETLSDGMKRLLEGLIAVNTSALADVTATRKDRIEDTPNTAKLKDYYAEHPAVRRHPETGRKALYVNFAHTERFKDMTREESQSILNFLFAHQVKAEFTCRFVWKPGSLALWDNRSSQHNPVNDYHGHRRVMHRITLAGDKPSS